MTFKELVDTFNALLTPVIAGTTIYIAWQQYQISQLIIGRVMLLEYNLCHECRNNF
jgi:hypothetical protein